MTRCGRWHEQDVGCLPKDIRASMAHAGELGADQTLMFLREVDNLNMRRPILIAQLAREVSDASLPGKRVAVLEAAVKPDTDDVRNSPASDAPPSCRCRAPSCG